MFHDHQSFSSVKGGETLTQLIVRPTANGTLQQIWDQYPATTSHWDKVDEASSDGDSTYLYELSATGSYDTFLYSVPSIQGKINSISVYVLAKRVDDGGWASPVVYLNGDYNYGTLYAVTTSYAQYGGAMTRPGGGSWTVADLANIQFGVYLDCFLPGNEVRCTQVWMVIDYTPPHSFGTII